MPKFTPLRERVLVAKATGNSEEIERIKREILGSHSGRVPETAKKLGMHQLTLRRIAEDLDIEAELGIDRARGEPSLLLSQARIAMETRNEKAAADLRKQILLAIEKAAGDGLSSAARIMNVSPWVLQRAIDVLGADDEVDRAFPGKYSLMGERILVAQRTGDKHALTKVRSEILAAFRRAMGDADVAALELSVTTQTLRRMSRELGLAPRLGFDEQNPESAVLASRVRIAQANEDRVALSQIRAEILKAFEDADGMLKYAAPRLNVGDSSLRQIIADLGMKAEIAEKFPGMGKERMLTARVDGRKQTRSLAEWAKVRELNRTTIIERLRRGYTPEQALSVGDMRETMPRPRRTNVCKNDPSHPSPMVGDTCGSCRTKEKRAEVRALKKAEKSKSASETERPQIHHRSGR